jgi:hypothetical protein
MSRDTLPTVAAAQLAVGLTGAAVGIARHRSYDVGFMHGDPEHMWRDAVVSGTALSAPAYMLATQALATRETTRNPRNTTARRALGVLGALMVAGYLGEAHVRAVLHPSAWDAVESPLAIAGIGLAAAMAAQGFTASRPQGAALTA